MVAEIVDEEEAVIRGEHGAVRMGYVLAGVIGAGMAEAGLLEVQMIDGLREGAVGLDLVSGYGGAGVVSDEDGLAGGVDGEVTGGGSGGCDLVEGVEGSGGIHGEGGDEGVGGAFTLIADVQDAALAGEAEGEPGGADAGGGEGGRSEMDGYGVEPGDVDALGLAAGGVGAEVDEGQWRGDGRFALEAISDAGLDAGLLGSLGEEASGDEAAGEGGESCEEVSAGEAHAPRA